MPLFRHARFRFLDAVLACIGFLLLQGVNCSLAVAQEQNVPLATATADDAKASSFVSDLLSKMTLEEKLGQMSQISYKDQHSVSHEERIVKGQTGSFLFLTDPVEINRLQHIAVEQTRLHIPLIFGYDVIHGFRTIYPIPLALAASWDPAVAQRVQSMAAREASAVGIRWTFAPMVDIARDARWGRMAEGSGEDPYLGMAMARAYVRGYQGTRLDAPDSIAACAKHFVGYGAGEAGRDYNSTEISEHTLREFYLPPFHAAVEEGAATIMSAFNS